MLLVEVLLYVSLVTCDCLTALRVEWADECQSVVNVEEVGLEVGTGLSFACVERTYAVRDKGSM